MHRSASQPCTIFVPPAVFLTGATVYVSLLLPIICAKCRYDYTETLGLLLRLQVSAPE